MARNKKTFKPFKSKKSGKKNDKRISKNNEVIKKYLS